MFWCLRNPSLVAGRGGKAGGAEGRAWEQGVWGLGEDPGEDSDSYLESGRAPESPEQKRAVIGGPRLTVFGAEGRRQPLWGYRWTVVGGGSKRWLDSASVWSQEFLPHILCFHFLKTCRFPSRAAGWNVQAPEPGHSSHVQGLTRLSSPCQCPGREGRISPAVKAPQGAPGVVWVSSAVSNLNH